MAAVALLTTRDATTDIPMTPNAGHQYEPQRRRRPAQERRRGHGAHTQHER
jgi:hypothetical protein